MEIIIKSVTLVIYFELPVWFFASAPSRPAYPDNIIHIYPFLVDGNLKIFNWICRFSYLNYQLLQQDMPVHIINACLNHANKGYEKQKKLPCFCGSKVGRSVWRRALASWSNWLYIYLKYIYFVQLIY